MLTRSIESYTRSINFWLRVYFTASARGRLPAASDAVGRARVLLAAATTAHGSEATEILAAWVHAARLTLAEDELRQAENAGEHYTPAALEFLDAVDAQRGEVSPCP